MRSNRLRAACGQILLEWIAIAAAAQSAEVQQIAEMPGPPVVRKPIVIGFMGGNDSRREK